MTPKYSHMFNISLLITGISGLVLSPCNLFAWQMPDWGIRLLGAVGVIALPFLVYSFVKTYIHKK